VPFVRFSRDKRGYEHFYLVHASSRRGRPSRSRVLYWYRTPPGVRVGREPFDEGARRLLEAQYPDLTFDWEALANTPIPPPPEVEPWRERRRAERAARRPAETEDVEARPLEETPPEAVDAEETAEEMTSSIDSDESPGFAEPAEAAESTPPAERVAEEVAPGRSPRRRRGGRRRRRSPA
jgi:hypothetical protein